MEEKKDENKKEKEFGKFERWEIEEGVQTIIKAEQIKTDREKMKYILPLLEQQKKALDNVASAAEILYGKKEDKENDKNDDKDQNKG